MNNRLKLILGEHFIFKVKELKVRWFPSYRQKEKIKKEVKEIEEKKLLYSTFIHQNDLCFDVGANMGNRISPLLEIGAKIVAIEPQEQCYNFLRKKFGKKIEIVSKGLGEKLDVIDFYISNSNTISSFSKEWIKSVKDGRFKNYNWNKIIKVEITTLDKLIEKYGIPKFIKIDVEGYELEVLRGLTTPIEIISFEYTIPEQMKKIMMCIRQIEKNDPNIVCNYSIGESMVMSLQVWKSVRNMEIYIRSEEFINSSFGDIYIRCNSNKL